MRVPELLVPSRRCLVALLLALVLVVLSAKPGLAATTTRINAGKSGFQPNNAAVFSTVSSSTPVCWNKAGCQEGPRVSFITRATDQAFNPKVTGQVHVWVAFPEGNFELASRASKTKTGPGASANADSSAAVISANGKFVVFASDADNLYGKDNNAATDIFRRNLQTDKTQLVSRASDAMVEGVRKPGVQANGRSYLAAISDDGQRIAFVSDATNLGAPDSNNRPDVFWRDMKTGKTLVLSVSPDNSGFTGNGASGGIVGGGYVGGIDISGDGRVVAFGSTSTDLTPTDGNGGYGDIFWLSQLDALSQETVKPTLASTNLSTQGNFDSYTPSLNQDGYTVAFWSTSTNLVDNDTNNAGDIFVRPIGSETVRVNVTNIGGGQDPAGARDPSISLSSVGNRVVFTSLGMLQEGSCPQAGQVYIRDLSAKKTERVSVGYNANCADRWSDYAAISADGKYVTFTSPGANLVSNDTNGWEDVFLRGTY